MKGLKPLILVLCMAWPVNAQPPQTPQRPFSRFIGETSLLGQRLDYISMEGFEAKRDQYRTQTGEKRLYVRGYDVGLAAAIGLWQVTGDKKYQQMAIKAVLPTLDGWRNRSDEQLIADINDQGSSIDANFEARDACYHLALHYYLTNDKQSAHKAAMILGRFAESIPKWPLWFPYYVEKGKTKKRISREDPKAFESQYSAGLWGEWIYGDLMHVAPLMHAYDMIYPSVFMQKMKIVRPIEKMFALHMQCQKRYNPAYDFSNMDASRIHGYFVYGELLRKPEVCHEAVNWIKAMFNQKIFIQILPIIC